MGPSGLTEKLKSSPTIWEKEQPPHMSPSLMMKDLLETPPKIKLPKIPPILSLMLKDLLEENSTTILSKKISDSGPSKSSKKKTEIDHKCKLPIKNKPKNSSLKKFPL